MRHTRTLALLAAATLALFAPLRGEEEPRNQESEPPGGLKPHRPELSYGPHPRHVLALWRADSSDGPTPFVVHVHGYRFRTADRMRVPVAFLKGCLRGGVSVASIDYRYAHDAPLPAPMHDAARAVQYLRSRAAELGLDPDRAALTGISTGGSMALWVALHGDLADSDAGDPVARRSTRVRCAAAWDAPTTFEPAFYREHRIRLPEGPVTLHRWCGLARPGRGPERAAERFAAVSPLTHASAGDPRVLLNYAKPHRYMTGELGLHHPVFGRALKKRLEEVGVGCLVREGRGWSGRRAHGSEGADRAILAFVLKHLKGEPETSAE